MERWLKDLAVVATVLVRLPGQPAQVVAHQAQHVGLGGPQHAQKDHGHWTIPKGGPDNGESLIAAAEREFREETGLVPNGPYLELGTIRQKRGKLVHAWGFAGEIPADWTPTSNTFTMEWPPLSGQEQHFPEVDRAEFFELDEALARVKKTQRPLITRLQETLGE